MGKVIAQRIVLRREVPGTLAGKWEGGFGWPAFPDDGQINCRPVLPTRRDTLVVRSTIPFVY